MRRLKIDKKKYNLMYYYTILLYCPRTYRTPPVKQRTNLEEVPVDSS
jgi:hypothetical protein